MLEKIKEILKQNPQVEYNYLYQDKLKTSSEELVELLKYRYLKIDEFNVDDLTLKVEEVFGGSEGDGEEYYIVFSATSGAETKYFKIPGWYQSYHGRELEINNTHEVVPAEKVIRVWNRA